jgi:hypothetical protein
MRVCRVVGIDVDHAARDQRISPEVVDAVHMVRMAVRVHDAVHRIDFGREHLRPKIRAGIYEDAGRPLTAIEPLDQRGATRSRVARLGGIARTPVTVDTRHAGGGATSQNG